MPRRVGVAAVNRKHKQQERFQQRGAELAEANLRSLSAQVETLRDRLGEFARNHRHEIRKNADFRRQFQEMCATIGVDPLASSKGFWSELLGVGDYYYELAVQIVEICMANNHRNGGLMSLDELHRRLVRSRLGHHNKSSRDESISRDDMLRAIATLKVLGNGFAIVKMRNGGVFVQSVPGELSMDQSATLQVADQSRGSVSVKMLEDKLGWQSERCRKVLQEALASGQVWVDEQASSSGNDDDENLYWYTSIFRQTLNEEEDE